MKSIEQTQKLQKGKNRVKTEKKTKQKISYILQLYGILR